MREHAPLSTVSLDDAISAVGDTRRQEPLRLTGTVLLERYAVGRALGSGGAGDVYEARDLTLAGRPVALKVLREPGAHGLYRLKQEFRSLADIRHENLVTLHELHLHVEHAFFTMELVGGVDFYSFVRPLGELDTTRLLHALRGLVQGVSALHRAGKLHRDLKPSNVLVSEEGRVVLVDFGLATALHETEDGHTERGFVGTVAYAAPEQLQGLSCGPACDWYAVGTMLYEVLTTGLPYDGSLAEIAQAKVGGKAPSEPEVSSALRWLADLSMSLLASGPDRRPSESDILAALGETSGQWAPARRVAESFVGRAAELSRLSAAFARVESGAQSVVLVEGPSGMGKTRLVQHFLDGLTRDRRACVLRGRCYVNEDVPYRALDGVVDALSHHLRSLPPLVSATLLPREMWALAVLFPVLRRVPSVAVLTPGRTSPSESERALRDRAAWALRELLLAMADRTPVVIFIDDIQWSDDDSAWLVPALLSGPLPPSLMFVTACRSEARGESRLGRALRSEKSLASVLEELTVSPLATSEVAELTARDLAPRAAAEVEAIARESAGHPLFALELARHAAGSDAFDPQRVSLDEAILVHVASLSEPSRRLLHTLCVAGHPLPRSFACDVSGADGDAVRELVREKLALMTRADGDGKLETYHDRVREALLTQVAPAEARETHAALGRAYASARPPVHDLAVEHFVSAGEREQAAIHALPAAAQALSSLAFHRVPALLALGAEFAPEERRAALQVELARAHARVGRVLEAARCYRVAAQLEPDATRRWDLECSAMWHALQGGDASLGFELVRSLGASLRSPVVAMPWLGWLTMTPFYVLWRCFGPPRLAQAPAETTAATLRERHMLRFAWYVASGLAQRDSRRSGYLTLVALRLAARLGDRAIYAAARAVFEAGKGAFSGVAEPSHLRALAQCAELADAAEEPGAASMVAVTQLSHGLCTGEFRAAETHAMRLAAMQTQGDEVSMYARSVAQLTEAALCFWRGRLRQGERHVDATLREARELEHTHMVLGLEGLGAYRRLCDDHAELALSEWQDASARDGEHAVFWDPVWGAVLGLYGARLDVVDAAIARAKRIFWRWTAYVSSSRIVFRWICGARAAAELGAGTGSFRARATLRLTCSALALERSPLREPFLFQLRAVRALGRGNRRLAVHWLERALRAQERHGMDLFAACTLRALARLTEGDERRANCAARAAVLFERERIVRPDRWEQALLPGLIERDITEPTPAQSSP